MTTDTQHDRWTSSVRPPLITDLNGDGWSAVPHGTLTPAEEQRVRVSSAITNPLYDAALRGGLVRLQQRTSNGSIDATLLHPRGAQALAGQLMEAAAEGLAVLDPQDPPPMMTLAEIFGKSVPLTPQRVQEVREQTAREAHEAGETDPELAILGKLRRSLTDVYDDDADDEPLQHVLGQIDAHTEARRLELERDRAENGPKLEKVLVRAVLFLERQEEGGVLSLALDTRPGPDNAATDEVWTAALTFGRKVEGSDMAAGQATGTADVAILALAQALDEAGA
jgi:hypothetical protein